MRQYFIKSLLLATILPQTPFAIDGATAGGQAMQAIEQNGNRNAPQLFMIFIKTTDDRPKTITLNVYPELTVLDAKKLIQLHYILNKNVDWAPSQQQLIFAGKNLQDSETLRKYRIGDEATLHLVSTVWGD